MVRGRGGGGRGGKLNDFCMLSLVDVVIYFCSHCNQLSKACQKFFDGVEVVRGGWGRGVGEGVWVGERES